MLAWTLVRLTRTSISLFKPKIRKPHAPPLAFALKHEVNTQNVNYALQVGVPQNKKNFVDYALHVDVPQNQKDSTQVNSYEGLASEVPPPFIVKGLSFLDTEAGLIISFYFLCFGWFGFLCVTNQVLKYTDIAPLKADTLRRYNLREISYENAYHLLSTFLL